MDSIARSIDPNKTKSKRRSKHDAKNRDYKCGCGKSYLSYPALYTHIKTKHKGELPEGTITTQQKSARGRGRPRKLYIADDSKERQDKEYEAEMKRKAEHNRIDKEFFDKYNASGGPADPKIWFIEDEETLSKVSKLHGKVCEQLKNKRPKAVDIT